MELPSVFSYMMNLTGTAFSTRLDITPVVSTSFLP